MQRHPYLARLVDVERIGVTMKAPNVKVSDPAT
jgi:hypothetical protein